MLRVVCCLYPFWVGDETVEDPDNHKCNFVHVDENADINDEILEILEMLILDANAKAADHHEELLEQCNSLHSNFESRGPIMALNPAVLILQWSTGFKN